MVHLTELEMRNISMNTVEETYLTMNNVGEKTYLSMSMNNVGEMYLAMNNVEETYGCYL